MDDSGQVPLTVQVSMASVHDGVRSRNKICIVVLKKLYTWQHYANFLDCLTPEDEALGLLIPLKSKVMPIHFVQLVRPNSQGYELCLHIDILTDDS